MSLEHDGFCIVRDLIPADQFQLLLTGIEQFARSDSATRRRASQVYAIRELLRVPAIRQLADSPAMRELAEGALGERAQPIRAIFFDKTPNANWKVTWHQDLSIPVIERIEVPGFGPWSVKGSGIWHVQPPASVLERMLTVRLHLDDCGSDNGPLRVLPGSHAQGILSDQQIAEWREKVTATPCLCPAGGATLVRPLLLHASSAATTPGHRRVIHIEFAGGDLPGGLQWGKG